MDKSDFPTAFSTDDKWEFRPESLPPIAYERPMHSEDIFYKKDPVFRIKARSHYLWAPTIVMCGLFFGFLYIVIFETPDSNDIKIRLIFAIFLFGFIFACLVRELIKRRDPVVAEVYDTGIWLNDYGVFTPYEKVFDVNLLYQGRRKFQRALSVNIHVTPDEKIALLKKDSRLRMLNFHSNASDISLDFRGGENILASHDPESLATAIYDLAVVNNSKISDHEPQLNIDPKLPFWERAKTFL